MTAMSDILARAIRMTRARRLGSTPSAAELTASLADAQAMFLTLPIRVLTDVLIDADYTAGENERITFTSGSPTVTYPTTVTPSFESERTPQNGAIVEVTATTGSTRKIYIAELKTWMTLTGLTDASEQPFGPTHDLDVSAMIAARICGPVLQSELPQDVGALANQARANIRRAFHQIVSPSFDLALLRRDDLTLATR